MLGDDSRLIAKECPLAVQARFWLSVNKDGPTIRPELGPCWVWLKSTDRGGYGRLRVGRSSGPRTSDVLAAHRVAFWIASGVRPLPTVVVMHKCDNPICVRSEHLEAGTHADNCADKVAKGRHARGDSSGARRHPERFPRGSEHWTKRTPERLASGDRHWSRTNPSSVRRGSRNHSAKLREDDVLEIRRRFVAGDSDRQIGAAFGVGYATIGDIRSGRTWSHVTTPNVGARGRFFVTPHAVAMWRERYEPDATYEQALRRIIVDAGKAHFVKALETGPQLWRGPKPRRARYIVTVCSEGELPSLITVLPPFDGWAR